MKHLLVAIIFLCCLASATVQETGSTYSASPPGINPYFSIPEETPVPNVPGKLVVTVTLEGPVGEKNAEYTAPGKALDYQVTVKNEGYKNATATLTVMPDGCKSSWFSWTEATLTIPVDGEASESLVVCPDMNTREGDYSFRVIATSPGSETGSSGASFKVQGYDYASETVVSGTGQFQLNKDVRSMNSGIKSTKDVYFSGTVDALVKNEYLLDRAKGTNPNFQEQDVVDNYAAVLPGDSLMGSESVRSSIAFGGIGARVSESYNLQAEEFKSQNFDLHQTGTLGRMADFRTADNFTGYLMLDAKQIKPGMRGIREHEEFLGSFEIKRRALFRDTPAVGGGCFGGACDFLDNLNAFASSA